MRYRCGRGKDTALTKYKWEVLGKFEGMPHRVLFKPPSEPIKTATGAELPPHVLTIWDDASLLAVGIRRTAIDAEPSKAS